MEEKKTDTRDLQIDANVADSQPDSSPKSPTAVAPRPRPVARAAAAFGAVLAVASWVSFFFDYYVTLIIGAVGIVLSIIGLRSGRGCLRDLAITALIAIGILMLIIGIFLYLLHVVDTLV